MTERSLTIAIASDHAGYTLKAAIIAAFPQHHFMDLGAESSGHRCDYPDQADKLAATMKDNPEITFGILVCGSGIGISIAGNRHSHLRVALCHDVTSAKLSRQHNDANVLALGERLIGQQTALDAVAIFLTEPFEGGRHLARVNKL